MELANYNFELTNGWLFHKGELDLLSEIPVAMSHMSSKAGGAIKELDFFKEGTIWNEVCIPHDWATELPFDKNTIPAAGFKERGTGWYYKSFKLDNAPIESARLVFDGVLGKCEVFVNGVIACRNFSGYNRFSAEIGDYLIQGEENVIAVYVDARRWEGWWYEGAGIYRSARIEFRPYTHLDKEKTFIKPLLKNNSWEIIADIGVAEKTDDYLLKVSLKDNETVLFETETKNTNLIIPVENPKLWNVDEPYLYCVEIALVKDKKTLDTININTAFKNIEWKKDEGMFLNGEHFLVKGICCHQDHAGVGAAMTKEIMEYRISILKELGVNAYRCAHHAPDEQLLDICDRMGMLVMVENRHFAVSEDVFKQIDALVSISRNHPSVFLYCLFNEEPWQSEKRGKRIAEKMRKRILSLDNTRPITGAQNGGLLEQANTSDVLDVIGVNYALKDYEASHKRLPDKVLIGTENCPTYATRGICKTDKEKQVFACYGDEYPDYFSESLTETMNTIFSKPFVAGCFAWSGFDYRGEPTPYEWPSVLSHWGFTDYCGFKKDTAYLLKAWYCDELTLHLLPHWNHKEGDNVKVCTFTNADTAELFVNGVSKGIKTVENKCAFWEIPFEKGVISAKAKRKNEIICREIKTADTAKNIVLENTSAFESDVHIINVKITDKNDNFVPDFCEKLTFKIEDGIILGVGNGNPNYMCDEKANFINCFNGMAQIIVKSTNGKITIKSENLPEVTLSFERN